MRHDVYPPFSPEVLSKLSAGETQALIMAVASFAGQLLRQAGLHPNAVYATMLVTLPPVQAGKAAAAIDLVRLLAHSPHGREALRDLGLEPVLHHVERE